MPDARADPHRYVSSVSAITFRGRKYRHGSALAHKTHIFRPCPDRSHSPSRPPRFAATGGGLAADRPRRRAAGRRRASCSGRCELPPDDPPHAAEHRGGPPGRSCAANTAKLFASLPGGVSQRNARLRSAPASPAATRRPSPRTAPTAASTSSTTEPGNRSAARATPRRLPRRSRTTAPHCSTPQSGSSPWPVCG